MNKCIVAALALSGFLGAASGAPSLDESMQKAAAEYRQKAEVAAKALNETRARIADEKAPLLEKLRAAEDRIIAAEGETTRLETQRDNSAELRRKLLQELESTRKVTDYADTLAHDGVRADLASLAPGEDQRLADQEDQLQRHLDDAVASGTSG